MTKLTVDLSNAFYEYDLGGPEVMNLVFAINGKRAMLSLFEQRLVDRYGVVRVGGEIASDLTEIIEIDGGNGTVERRRVQGTLDPRIRRVLEAMLDEDENEGLQEGPAWRIRRLRL